MSFFKYYFNLGEAGGEHTVLCPFPHAVDGIAYQEVHPSAHVNIDKKLFHCKSCGKGSTEINFMLDVLDIDLDKAMKLKTAFDTDGDLFDWLTRLRQLTPEAKQTALDLGFSEAVIEELKIAGICAGELMFPVFAYNKLMDIRTYRKGGDPKVISMGGSAAGHIIPFDQWAATPISRWTVVCAGEKDMAIARTHGFNAITITGGENALPILGKEFTGRNVAIAYDNDQAGIMGAMRLAKHLLKYTTQVRILYGLHDVCVEKGEDVHDYFMKYGKTAADFKDLILKARNVTFLELGEVDAPPMVNLREASQHNMLNRILKANVQVVATMEDTFSLESAYTLTKYTTTGRKDADSMNEGEMRSWQLNDKNVGEILRLIDGNLTEPQIIANQRYLAGVPVKEGGISKKVIKKAVIFKCSVIDMFESTANQVTPMEYGAYSIDTKLESGRKYEVTFKLVPHPFKGQKLIMIILDAKDANDSVNCFQLNMESLTNLSMFTSLQGTVEERITALTQKVKGLLGYNGNDKLIQTIDLAYHTPLYFNMGTFRNIRAYLDIMVVGESRVGKSSTAETLRNTYALGTFTSLAGTSATIPGLIGGSHKTSSGFQTRAGLIPQNHKGLMIFEEFGKCKADVVKELTDIRSSNEVRIARVSGSLTLPAMVRMISLTNVKSHSGEIKSIASYPNGLEIIAELVGAAEDIARYDVLAVFGDRGNSLTDPYWEPEAPLPTEAYKTRIRWVWSRTAEQIVIDREVGAHLIAQANDLNKHYESHIKVFGTEGWKKLARLSIAVAAYLVSTDSTYENIVVLKEHVDFAKEFFVSLYDNEVFRLREYVERERMYSRIDAAGIQLLQDLYNMAPAMLQFLETSSTTTRQTLISTSGLSNDQYNGIMTQLVQGMFVRNHNNNILPSERFRIGMRSINRMTRVPRIGEMP